MGEIRRINSLIKEYFSDSLMRKLERVYYTRDMFKLSKETFDKFEGKFRYKISDDGKSVYVRIKDNNDKILLYKNFIKLEWGKDVTFGTGTNRMGIIKDSYVFKIACDAAGCTDNLHEFIMSKELQPYVTKAYETNELICVCEYVRVFNETSDFENAKDEILNVLQALEERSSLMIDVGFILKNKTNWGWRPSTGLPVVLDYGYIYTELPGIQLTCSDKDCIKKWGVNNLVYSKDYSYMVCPCCNEKYGSAKLQKLVTHEARTRMYKDRLDEAFKVNKSISYFEVDEFGYATELENGSDEMLSKKEKLRVNYEEIMEKYEDVCCRYDRELLFTTEVDEQLASLKETLRRALIEAKYNKPYKSLNESQKNEDPREDKEFINRYKDLYIKSESEYEIEDLFGNSLDEEAYEKIKEEFDDADTPYDTAGYLSIESRQKALSRYMVKIGEEPLIEDYDDNEPDEYDIMNPDNWEDVYEPKPTNGYASVNWSDADEMLIKKHEGTNSKKKEYTKDGILKMDTDEFFNWDEFKGSEILDLDDPEVKEKEEAKLAEMEEVDDWFNKMVFNEESKNKVEEENQENNEDDTEDNQIITEEVANDLVSSSNEIEEKISDDVNMEPIVNLDYSILNEYVNDPDIKVTGLNKDEEIIESPEELESHNPIIYADEDLDNPLADALKVYYQDQPELVKTRPTTDDFNFDDIDMDEVLNEVDNQQNKPKLDERIRFILPTIECNMEGDITEIYFQEIDLDITVEQLDEYGMFTIGDNITIDGYHRIDNKLYLNRIIDGYRFDRENLEYVKVD